MWYYYIKINHCSDAMHCVATICNEEWHQTARNTAMLFAPPP